MGLLATAGMISGAGKAGTDALNTLQQGSIQAFLQQERSKMELERERTLQQERQEFEAGQTNIREAGAEKRLGMELTQREEHQKRSESMDVAKMRQQADLEREKLESEEKRDTIRRIGDNQRFKMESEERKAHYKATESYHNQMLALYKLQHMGDKDEAKEIKTDQNGGYYAITKSGTAKPILGPNGQQIVGPKGVSDAVKIVSDGLNEQIKTLQKEQVDPLKNADEKATIQRTIDALRTEQRSLLGMPEKARPAYKEPFAEPASQTAPSKPDSEKYFEEGAEMTKRDLAAEKPPPSTAQKTADTLRSGLLSKPAPTVMERAIDSLLQQLQPSSGPATQTLQDIEDYIKFSKDPRFVEAYIKRFGSEPSAADFERLKRSKQRPVR